MKDFNKDLNDAANAAKALAQKIEKLQQQYAEMMGKHPKMPAKKAPGKKTEKAIAEKTVTKKAMPKKREVTATDTVLAIVNRSKNGVDSDSVMKKTGFDKKKVANLFASLKKQGKIKSAKLGVYLKA